MPVDALNMNCESSSSLHRSQADAIFSDASAVAGGVMILSLTWYCECYLLQLVCDLADPPFSPQTPVDASVRPLVCQLSRVRMLTFELSRLQTTTALVVRHVIGVRCHLS